MVESRRAPCPSERAGLKPVVFGEECREFRTYVRLSGLTGPYVRLSRRLRRGKSPFLDRSVSVYAMSPVLWVRLTDGILLRILGSVNE
jgi:hypothetical protein